MANLRREFTNLPNLVTMGRVALVPFVLLFIDNFSPLRSYIASLLYLGAAAGDALDGYLARSRGQVSMLGKFLDPLADKLVVSAALIMLAAIARSPRVPTWIVVVLVSREILVTGLRAVAATEGRIIAAEDLGKYKMVLQSIAVQGLLVHYTYFHIDFFAGGMFILWIALALSVWSGIEYFVKAAGIIDGASPSTRIAKRAAG